jgi:hypothetical protein
MILANQDVQEFTDLQIDDIDFSINLNFCFHAQEINDIFLEIQSENNMPARNITQEEYSNLVEQLSRYIQEQMEDWYERELYGYNYIHDFIEDHFLTLIKQ